VVTITGPTSPVQLGAEYQNVVQADSPYAYYRLGEGSGITAAMRRRITATAPTSMVRRLANPGQSMATATRRPDSTAPTISCSFPAALCRHVNGITLEAWVNAIGHANVLPHLQFG